MKTINVLNGSILGKLAVGERAHITNWACSYTTSEVKAIEATAEAIVITTANSRYVVAKPAQGVKKVVSIDGGCIIGTLEIGKPACFTDWVCRYTTSAVRKINYNAIVGGVIFETENSRYILSNVSGLQKTVTIDEATILGTIEVGKPATIMDGNYRRKTSAVQKVQSVSGCTVITTENSRYILTNVTYA